jgi:uncharacterized membrane protein YhaH (DUF805 family)
MSIAQDDRYYSQNAYASPSATWEAAPVDQRKRGLLWLLLSFEGRIPRRAYWLAILTANFGYAFAILSLTQWTDRHEPSAVLHIAPLLVVFIYIWINLATKAKRWHDRDKSALWLLIGFVPIVGALWQLVELGFLPGTSGRNTFGEEYNLNDLA